jgi:hypothetical protein
LHSLKLGPAGTQEGHSATRKRLRWSGSRRSSLRGSGLWQLIENRLVAASAATAPPVTCGGHELSRRCLRRGVAVALRLLLDRDATGTADECRIELVDVSSVGERSREIGARGAILGRG